MFLISRVKGVNAGVSVKIEQVNSFFLLLLFYSSNNFFCSPFYLHVSTFISYYGLMPEKHANYCNSGPLTNKKSHFSNVLPLWMSLHISLIQQTFSLPKFHRRMINIIYICQKYYVYVTLLFTYKIYKYCVYISRIIMSLKYCLKKVFDLFPKFGVIRLFWLRIQEGA